MKSSSYVLFAFFCKYTICTALGTTVNATDHIFQDIPSKSGTKQSPKFTRDSSNIFQSDSNGYSPGHSFRDATGCISMYSPSQIEELPEGDTTSFTLDLQCPSQDYLVSLSLNNSRCVEQPI